MTKRKTKTCIYTQKPKRNGSNPAVSGLINGKLIFGVDDWRESDLDSFCNSRDVS